MSSSQQSHKKKKFLELLMNFLAKSPGREKVQFKNMHRLSD